MWCDNPCVSSVPGLALGASPRLKWFGGEESGEEARRKWLPRLSALPLDLVLATKREPARRLTRADHVNPALDLSKQVFFLNLEQFNLKILIFVRYRYCDVSSFRCPGWLCGSQRCEEQSGKWFIVEFACVLLFTKTLRTKFWVCSIPVDGEECEWECKKVHLKC